MQSYIKEKTEIFREEVSRGVTSPATSRLFDVTEGAEKLLEEKAATFQATVEKLLWRMKSSRPDIETATYFL